MKRILKIIGAVIAFFAVIIFIGGESLVQKLFTGAKLEAQWNTAEGDVLKDLSYGEGYRNTYDLYLPANNSPKALMLFIHGGSWISGQKEDMAWAAERYAKEGYVTASINYTRLRSDSMTYESGYVKPCMQSMMAEIGTSIKAIKAKCAELGCNIEQMSIGGYSAGAHLAMLYSTLYADKSPIPIKFQISWVGPSDFNLLFPTPEKADVQGAAPAEERGKFVAQMNEFIYGLSGKDLDVQNLTVEQIKAIKSVISPVEQVNRNTPPAVLVYGDKDRLVNAVHGKKMSEMLAANGVHNQLFIFPNSGHELGHDPEYAERVQHTILEFCKKYFE
ncbi:MAG: alpha/beta hydrolase [Alistipes sp.]|nr:alpha/beta hydrolase [Alistipes sp.]